MLSLGTLTSAPGILCDGVGGTEDVRDFVG